MTIVSVPKVHIEKCGVWWFARKGRLDKWRHYAVATTLEKLIIELRKLGMA